MKKMIIFVVVTIITILIVSCADATSKDLKEQGSQNIQSEEDDAAALLEQEEFLRELEWEREKWFLTYDEILYYTDFISDFVDLNWILTSVNHFTYTLDTGFVTRSGKPKASELEFYVLKWEDKEFLGMEYVKCGGRCTDGYFIYPDYPDLPDSICGLCMGTGLMENDRICYSYATVDMRLFLKLPLSIRSFSDPQTYGDIESGIYPSPWIIEYIQYIIDFYNEDVIQNGEPKKGWY